MMQVRDSSHCPSAREDEPLVWHSSPPDFPPPTGCRRVWVPFRGYLDVDDDIRGRVDKFFAMPMLALALLVLPVLVVDYYLTRHGRDHPLLAHGVLISHIAVSTAFLAEFAVKVSIAESRLSYVLRNWLDMIIIMLPFLRPFRALRAAYAVRGVGFKAVKTLAPVLLGLRFVQRFQKPRPQVEGSARVDYARWSRASLIAEIKRLSERVRELEHSSRIGEDTKP